jgi:hypothetical protein
MMCLSVVVGLSLYRDVRDEHKGIFGGIYILRCMDSLNTPAPYHVLCAAVADHKSDLVSFFVISI